MIKVFTFFAAVLLTASVFAQSPEKVSYQAVIRDASDNLVTDQSVGMQISILQGSIYGAAVYVETHSPTTNANGLVSLEIGTGTVLNGDFTTIDWANGPYFIKTETDPAGGTSYTITGTSQLLSVPYALHAKHADSVTISGDETAFDGWDKDSSDDFDGQYNSLDGAPTNVSAFTNDAGYLTTIPNQAIGIEYTSSSYALWVISASPEFRGRLYGSNDDPVNGVLSMSFGLYDNETSGTQVWSEVIDLAFTDGFFSGTLGTNAPFAGIFETYPDLFMEITVGAETLTPRFQIEQAGKAFYAQKAGEIDYANVNNTPDLSNYDSNVNDDFNGQYSNLTGAPQNVSTFTNDAGYLTTDTTLNESEVDAMVANNGYADQTALEDTASQIRADIPTVTTSSVGDFAQGGIVFWVDETGQHGLVAAKEDQDGGSGIQWYNGSNTNTEAHGDGVYAGEMNTMLIIANQGSNSNDYAAGVCANYTVTESGVTYGDWYLPSKEELNLMYQNKAAIDATAGANGGSAIASVYYWSSTEANNDGAWGQNFDNGNQGNSSKSFPYYMRAVRAF